MNLPIVITDKSQIKKEILAYFEENPEAKDSLEGIRDWWMLNRKIEIIGKVVEDALYDLVNEGLVYRDGKGKYSFKKMKDLH